jgi:hypothetical protein
VNPLQVPDRTVVFDSGEVTADTAAMRIFSVWPVPFVLLHSPGHGELRPLSLPCDKRLALIVSFVVLAMAATMAGTTARAEEWLSLSKTSDEHPTEVFIDLSSITVTDNLRTVRRKAVLLSPRNENERRIAFAIQPMSFDCKASLVQAGSVEIHYTDTENLGFIDTHKSWEPVNDPLTQKLLSLVCAFKQSPTSKGSE